MEQRDFGHARFIPATAAAGQTGQWEIRYVVGEAGIKQGGSIRITSPRKGLDRWDLGKVLAFCDNPDIQLEVVTEKAHPPTTHHSHYAAADVIVYGGDLTQGEEIRVVMGALGGYVSGRFIQAKAQTHASWTRFGVYVDHQGNGRFSREKTREGVYHEVPGELDVEVKPGDAARIRVTVRPSPAPGKGLIGVASVEDAYENPIEDRGFDLALFVEDGEIEVPARIRKPARRQGVTFPVRGAGGGTNRVGASCWRQGIYGASNPVAPNFARNGHTVYFGDMHVMTGSAKNLHMDSDTEGALRYARDVFGLDFTAVTNSLRPDRWPDDRDLFEAYNQDHEFVTIPAYENGLRTGHKNVYFPRRYASVQRASTAEKMWEALGGRECMVISHHTNTPSETDPERAWGPLDISTVNPRYERLIEICQNRGSFEKDEVGGEVSLGGYGSSIRDVLATGLRLGFVGGTDSHRGRPGSRLSNQSGMDARELITGGTTGVFCPELTREAVWEALMARRCYATTSVRMLLDFEVNGLPMGQERRVTAANRKRFATRSVTVRAVGVRPLARAVIVRNGVEVHEESVDDMECTLYWEDRESLKQVHDTGIRGAYYYAKVYQEDGNVAWSSPVWLTYGR